MCEKNKQIYFCVYCNDHYTTHRRHWKKNIYDETILKSSEIHSKDHVIQRQCKTCYQVFGTTHGLLVYDG